MWVGGMSLNNNNNITIITIIIIAVTPYPWDCYCKTFSSVNGVTVDCRAIKYILRVRTIRVIANALMA